MNNKIKIGIIGTGVGIRTHLNGFRLFDKYTQIYAIAGSSLERSKEFAEKYNIPVACSDYKELCDIGELDLVCITAPNKFHKEMIDYAIKKNKNIICEKPMVETMEDAQYIINLTKNYKKLFIIDHQLRFNPYMIEIKKIIDKGILGKIYSIRINQEGNGFANENANWSWSFDSNEGGVRLAMASHFTDLVQFFFDSRPVVSVTASLNPITKKRIDNQEKTREILASTMCNAFILLQDELTVQYNINAGAYNKSKFEISIFGDKGELTFSLQDKLNLYLRSSIGKCEEIIPNKVYEDEIENMPIYYIGGSSNLPPPLTSEEEETLLNELEEGKLETRQKLVERNLRLVVYIAKKFENTGVGLEDLISIGTIGLMKGVNTFNTGKNIKLATYASRCIENEILMYLRRSNRIKGEISIDEPLNQDGDGNELLLSDILGTEPDITSRRIEDEVDKQLLKASIEKLNSRERNIMELRFGFISGDEKTQKEVADMLRNITKLHIKVRKENNIKNEKGYNEQDRIKSKKNRHKNKNML